MMQKSGYFRKTGCLAYDAEGRSHEVIELHIRGVRFAIRRAELVRAIAGRVCVQVEVLVHDWKYYLGAVTGLARVSASGKALNINLFGTGDFTVSLLALKSVLFGNERNAIIVKIPEERRSPYQGVSCHQRHLEAGVS